MGESVAKLFSSLGAKVVVTGRNRIQLEKVGKEVSQLSPHGLKVN
jgi:short-subunit dehydrogenase involved in D-alanine esterification of teichoic acids